MGLMCRGYSGLRRAECGEQAPLQASLQAPLQQVPAHIAATMVPVPGVAAPVQQLPTARAPRVPMRGVGSAARSRLQARLQVRAAGTAGPSYGNLPPELKERIAGFLTKKKNRGALSLASKDFKRAVRFQELERRLAAPHPRRYRLVNLHNTRAQAGPWLTPKELVQSLAAFMESHAFKPKRDTIWQYYEMDTPQRVGQYSAKYMFWKLDTPSDPSDPASVKWLKFGWLTADKLEAGSYTRRGIVLEWASHNVRLWVHSRQPAAAYEHVLFMLAAMRAVARKRREPELRTCAVTLQYFTEQQQKDVARRLALACEHVTVVNGNPPHAAA